MLLDPSRAGAEQDRGIELRNSAGRLPPQVCSDPSRSEIRATAAGDVAFIVWLRTS